MSKSNTDKSFDAASLIVKYLRGGLTKQEKEELETWKRAAKGNEQLFNELANAPELESQLKEFGNTDTQAGWQRLLEKLNAGNRKWGKTVYLKTGWKAAAAILILGLATWQIWLHSFNKPTGDVKPAGLYGQEVPPGTSRGELILSDGSTVSLGNGRDTSFTEKGSMVKQNADGAIEYGKGPGNEGHIDWNTLRIPNAGEYMVILEDGTKVWLNAATTLRYPVQFAGNERRVELVEGEAFFEVAKNKEKPFIVVADQMEVQAVGTQFNVNNYPGADRMICTTLAEGKVKVTSKEEINFLVPGESAILRPAQGGMIKTVKANVEDVTAWKNGLFIFNKMPLPQALQQIARWYDVKIEYDKEFTDQKFITGEIKRNVPISELLQMMELTGLARFRVASNTVTVMPYLP